MLNYAETARSSTNVPVVLGPCSQHQEHTADRTTSPSSPTSSYAIGPIDPAQFTTLSAHLATGEEYALLVPIHLPLALFLDAMFKDGYECGYLYGELDEGWTIPRIVNWTYYTIQDELYEEEAWEELGLHLPAWVVGWVIGDLAGLAETERTLALVGLAHLCFLLPFLALDADAPCWPRTGGDAPTFRIVRRSVPTASRCVRIVSKADRSVRRNGRTWQQAGRSWLQSMELCLSKNEETDDT